MISKLPGEGWETNSCIVRLPCFLKLAFHSLSSAQLRSIKPTAFTQSPCFYTPRKILEATGDRLTREARILRVKKIVLEHFTEQHWREMAVTISCSELVEQHERSLGSITWGDDAYATNVLNVLMNILHQNPSDLERLESCAFDCLAKVQVGSFAGVTLVRI